MASVVLTELWLNLRSDESQYLALQYVSGVTAQPQMQISSRVYADGRARVSYTQGRQSQVQMTLQAVTQAQRDVLEKTIDESGWLGEIVWFRDDRGRKFAGCWAPPQITEHSYNGECDVSLTVTEVYVDDIQ